VRNPIHVELLAPSIGGVVAEFQVFSKALVPLKRDPTVTLQKNGAISLNRASFVILGSPAAVELLYDKETRTIGMRGVDAEVEHGYAVRAVAGPGSAPFVISGLSFLRFYKVEQAVSRRWIAYSDGDVLCIDVDDESLAVTSNRAKKTNPGRRAGDVTPMR
jgi:hypothetical protein